MTRTQNWSRRIGEGDLGILDMYRCRYRAFCRRQLQNSNELIALVSTSVSGLSNCISSRTNITETFKKVTKSSPGIHLRSLKKQIRLDQVQPTAGNIGSALSPKTLFSALANFQRARTGSVLKISKK